MRALLMLGSPREGASLKLGRALLARLAEQGLETEEYPLVRSWLAQDWAELEKAVAAADLLILSSPSMWTPCQPPPLPPWRDWQRRLAARSWQ